MTGELTTETLARLLVRAEFGGLFGCLCLVALGILVWLAVMGS